MTQPTYLGIDVGASGIKGAIVDINTGEFVGERNRIDMPNPSTPEAVTDVILRLVRHFNWSGPIGVGFPAVIRHGVAMTAANIDNSWIGINVENLFSEATGCPVFVANDADLAGLAEIDFGVGKGEKGVVILITIGTGLGSAMFNEGVLVPNSELGHLYLETGRLAEEYASNAAQKREELSWKKWGKRFDEYLQHLERLFWPDLFILGGGTSKYFDEFSNRLTVGARVIPAKLFNNAGIVGAAAYAWERTR